MSKSLSVLIVLHGAIGDVTRALPLAVRIKHFWPESRITWGVEPISAPLLLEHPAVDEVVVFQRGGGLSAFREYVSELRSKTFDIVLDLQRHFKSGTTSLLSGGKRRIGFNRGNAKEFNWLFNDEHIEPVEHFSPKIEYYQRFGDLLGLERMSPLEFGLEPKASQIEKIQDLITEQQKERRLSEDPPGGFVGLILGSTWPSRFWPAERYAQLVRDIEATYSAQCIMVGSRSEEQSAAQIEELLEKPSLLNLVSKTSLLDLTAVFRLCRFAVGSDSGPMHIAAAVGTPIVSLWGSTSHERSAPYGSEEFVLSSPIGCSPCFRKECPGLGTLCMEDLPVAAVLAQVERILSSRLQKTESTG